jgi:cytochrome c biogenesis protein CcmG/thiol:disulfide interchange protein DsbE
MKRYLWPLGVFVVLMGFLFTGLSLNPREVPSPLVNQPVPAFNLPTLAEPDRRMAPEHMLGQVWLLNVWASWCVACQLEHPVLVDMARSGAVNLIGLNYKDRRDLALGWLGKHGNPYQSTVSDTDGRVGLDFGVYGVPETYVIDRQGVIRHKHTGPVTAEVVRDTLLPLIKKL